MSKCLVQKVEELRIVGVRLFDLLDDLQVTSDPKVSHMPVKRSDFALAQVARKLLAERRRAAEPFSCRAVF